MTVVREIEVNRYQFSVGQGSFHVQEINLLTDKAHDTFRVVYDCGGLKSEIDSRVNQLRAEKCKSLEEKLKIDALYLSHFEQDHLNGLKTLAKKADIKRIFLPYIDANDALVLIAQHIYSKGSISLGYAKDLVSISNGGSIQDLERIAIIRVQPGLNEPPRRDVENIQVPDQDNRLGESIKNNMPDSTEVIANKAYELTSDISFWELVHWAYKPNVSNDLTAKVVKELQTEFGSMPIEAKEIVNWVADNPGRIKKAYETAIGEFNKGVKKRIKPNHNLVSLCLYSGPLQTTLINYKSNSRFDQLEPETNFAWYRWMFCSACQTKSTINCLCGIRKGGWLGTGDAMLGLSDVWERFKEYFDIRLDDCSTITIPHHGAGSKYSFNYRPDLVQFKRKCVISAGAKNRYDHPHKDVVLDINNQNGILILVTENNPPGFIEELEYISDDYLKDSLKEKVSAFKI